MANRAKSLFDVLFAVRKLLDLSFRRISNLAGHVQGLWDVKANAEVDDMTHQHGQVVHGDGLSVNSNMSNLFG